MDHAAERQRSAAGRDPAGQVSTQHRLSPKAQEVIIWNYYFFSLLVEMF